MSRFCPQCVLQFEERRPDQVYCSNKCRLAHYKATRGDGALRAPIRTVKALSNGDVSITLRFAAIDRENAFLLTPGRVVELIAEGY